MYFGMFFHSKPLRIKTEYGNVMHLIPGICVVSWKSHDVADLSELDFGELTGTNYPKGGFIASQSSLWFNRRVLLPGALSTPTPWGG